VPQIRAVRKRRGLHRARVAGRSTIESAAEEKEKEAEAGGDAMEQRGRFFEDYTVGEVIRHWPGRTIRDVDDTWFTLLTMNTNPLHFDEHYASHTQHGRCLVNGVLVFAIAVGMSVADMSLNAIANLEYESVRHLAPTFHGDTLYSESTVLAKSDSKSKPDRGVLTVETRCRNQRDETVLTLRRRILMPKQR
jgi:acyl dehydratase